MKKNIESLKEFYLGVRFFVGYKITLPIGATDFGVGLLSQIDKVSKQHLIFILDKGKEECYEKSCSLIETSFGKHIVAQITSIYDTGTLDSHGNKRIKVYVVMKREPFVITMPVNVGQKINLEISTYKGKKSFLPYEYVGLYRDNIYLCKLEREYLDQASILDDYLPGCIMKAEVVSILRTFQKMNGMNVTFVFVKLLSDKPVCEESFEVLPDFKAGKAVVYRHFKSGRILNVMARKEVPVDVNMNTYRETKKDGKLEVVTIMSIYTKENHVHVGDREYRRSSKEFIKQGSFAHMVPNPKHLPELSTRMA